MLSKLKRQWRALFHKRQVERELDEELRYHLEREIERNLQSGDSRTKAIHSAFKSFGGMEQSKEHSREIQGVRLCEDIQQDLRFGARMLWKHPIFTIIAVLTIALGIGINTAVFSIVDGVILRPLPYGEPGRLVVLWTDEPAREIHEALVSYPNYTDWSTQNEDFSDLAFCTRSTPVTISGADEPERLDAVFASANLFSVLSVAPVIGRTFSGEEDFGKDRLVVLSYRLWQRRFGGAGDVVGHTLEIDGNKALIIGVMPASFKFPGSEIQLWQPLGSMRDWDKVSAERKRPLGMVLGKLKPKVTIGEARNAMRVITGRLAAEHPELTRDPDFSGFGINLVSLDMQFTGDVRLGLWMLLGAVGFVLLIGCTNVANLLLARGARRQKELAIRAAVGASRARLVRQLLIESIALAGVSGLIGTILAVVAIPALVAFAPPNLPRLDEVSVNIRVLIFTAAISILSGLVFGLIPALQASRIDPQASLKATGHRQGGESAGQRAAGLLIAGEFAIALMLLCGAGLLLRSFMRLKETPLGFETQNVLVARVVLPSSRTASQEAMFYHQALERIIALPGVGRAGVVSNLLVNVNPNTTIVVEGHPVVASAGRQVTDDVVSPSFFQVLGVPLRSGRWFSDRDGQQSPHVALVNETFARQFWPGEDPLGKRFAFGDGRFSDPWTTVVGVVGNMRRNGLEREPIAQVFLPLAQLPSRGADLVVRTLLDPSLLAGSIRRQLASYDPTVPVYRVTTLEDRLGEEANIRLFSTWVLGLFATVALFLAASGIYGVMHYMVECRTHEIGIRLALGARKGDVLQLVIMKGMTWVIIGAGIGSLLSLLLTRFISSMLFGVGATDPTTFLGVPPLLITVASIACYMPARRASRTDPLASLRSD